MTGSGSGLGSGNASIIGASIIGTSIIGASSGMMIIGGSVGSSPGIISGVRIGVGSGVVMIGGEGDACG